MEYIEEESPKCEEGGKIKSHEMLIKASQMRFSLTQQQPQQLLDKEYPSGDFQRTTEFPSGSASSSSLNKYSKETHNYRLARNSQTT